VKLLGILALALVAMGAGNALSGDVPAADWRLQAFDEANGYLAKMQENEQAFLVGKEPRLADFYRNVGPLAECDAAAEAGDLHQEAEREAGDAEDERKPVDVGPRDAQQP